MVGMVTIETHSGMVERRPDVRDIRRGFDPNGASGDSYVVQPQISESVPRIVKVETPNGTVRREEDVRDLSSGCVAEEFKADPEAVATQLEALRINHAIRAKERELLATAKMDVPLSDCLRLAVREILTDVEQNNRHTLTLDDGREVEVVLYHTSQPVDEQTHQARMRMVQAVLDSHVDNAGVLRGAFKNLGIAKVQLVDCTTEESAV